MFRSRQPLAAWSTLVGLFLGVWLTAAGAAVEDHQGRRYTLGDTAVQPHVVRLDLRLPADDCSQPPQTDGDLALRALDSDETREGGQAACPRKAASAPKPRSVWFHSRAPPFGSDV